MSQENVELVVKQFERTKARGFAGVMDTWADDLTVVEPWAVGKAGSTAPAPGRLLERLGADLGAQPMDF